MEKPKLIVGAFAEGTYVRFCGVEAVGFELPEGLQIVGRDYGHGNEPDEHGMLYEEVEVN